MLWFWEFKFLSMEKLWKFNFTKLSASKQNEDRDEWSTNTNTRRCCTLFRLFVCLFAFSQNNANQTLTVLSYDLAAHVTLTLTSTLNLSSDFLSNYSSMERTQNASWDNSWVGDKAAFSLARTMRGCDSDPVQHREIHCGTWKCLN